MGANRRQERGSPEVRETIPGRFAIVCRDRADAVAVVDGDRRVTYAELDRRVEEAADRLTTEATLGPGDRAIVSLPNGLEFVTGFLAVARLGAIAVPIRPDLRAPELVRYTETVRPRCVITSGRVDGEWRRVAEGSGAMWIVYAEERSSAARFSPSRSGPVSPSDASADVLYLSTSGTTGRPKLVPRSHARLLAGVCNVARALDVAEADRFLAVVPFHHANGFSNCMLLPLMHGCTTVSLSRFRPRELALVVREEGITVLIGSPLIFAMLVEQGTGRDAFATVRVALSSGAPMHSGLVEDCVVELGLRVRQLYGSTETGTIAIEPHDAAPAVEAAGAPVPGVDIRVLDERGEDVPQGVVGEVLVRSPAMMPGYVGQGDGDPDTCHEGYLRTGDLGRVDDDGLLRLEGRKKAVLNVAGIQVDPVEIENVLASMPGIRAARVGSALDTRGLEIIEAEVQPEAGTDVARKDVVAFCRARLAEYKIPRVIRIVDRVRPDLSGKDRRMFGR